MTMEGKKRYILLNESEGVYKELGSEFIARVFPLSRADEYKEKEESFRKAHPKADHYPYAFVIGDYLKSSDDGEPGGTAGRPMASMFTDRGIDQAGVIVARYFGGTKLGVPGLRRAFLSAMEEALKSVRLGEEKRYLDYPISVDYSTFDLLNGLAKRGHFQIIDTQFDVKVALILRSSGTIDALLEKKGIRLYLPSPQETIVFEEATK